MNIQLFVVCFQLVPLVSPDSVEQPNAAEARDVARLQAADSEMRDLPDDVELVVGVEVFGVVLEELESPRYRQRVLLSLGRAHVQMGNTREAADFLGRAVAIEEGDSRVVEIARRALAQLLADDGEFQDALRILESAYGNANQVTNGAPVGEHTILSAKVDAHAWSQPRRDEIDDEFLNLLKQAELLQQAGRIEESVEILSNLESGSTDPVRIQLILPIALESVVMAHMTGRYDEELELYDQILADIPALGDDAQLQSNRIYAAIAGKRDQLAVKQGEEFIARFPDSDLTCAHLFNLGQAALQQNDPDRAAEYFERLVNHPKVSDEYLGLVSEHTGLSDDQGLNVPPSSNSFFRILITLNVAAAVIIVIGYMLKRRRGTSLTSPPSSHSGG